MDEYRDAFSRATSQVRHRIDVRGAIIGVVDLVDVHRPLWNDACADDAGGPCSPWAERDAHHLVLANPRMLVDPLPWAGALGLRKCDLGIMDGADGEWLVEHYEPCRSPGPYGCPPGCHEAPLTRLVPTS